MNIIFPLDLGGNEYKTNILVRLQKEMTRLKVVNDISEINKQIGYKPECNLMDYIHTVIDQYR